MSVALFYSTDPRYVIPRGYLTGFVIRASVSDLTIDADSIRFTELGFGQQVVLALYDNVYAASTIAFTLDHLIDGDNSFFYLNGVPQAAGIILGIGRYINEAEYSCLIDINLSPVDGSKASLPRKAGYWYPYSPDLPA